MSITPSIALIPSGFKTSKVYSVLPENGDVDFNFSRGSSAYRTNEQGLLELVSSNVPRLDWYKSTCPSLMIEPQATNLIEYSNDFSNSRWTKGAGTSLSYNTNETTSPDGLNTATKITGNGTSGIFWAGINVSGSVSRSIYIKSVSENTTAILKDPNAGGAGVLTLDITREWKRVELNGDNGISSAGIWVNNIKSSGVYIWGAQLETGSNASSYIPTIGSTATRQRDSINKGSLQNYINSKKGVMYVSVIISSGSDNSLDVRVFGNSNGIFFFVADNALFCNVFSSNVSIFKPNLGGFTIGEITKMAVLFDEDKISVFRDGVTIVNEQQVSNQLSGMNEVLLSNGFRDYLLNDFRIYDQILSVNEIKKLTTL